jgi:hypothetical protein
VSRAEQAEARVQELMAEISLNQTMITELKSKPIEVKEIAILPKFSEEELNSLKEDHR